MRTTLILGTALALVLGVTGLAEEDATKAPAPTVQQLKVQMHRTMADLLAAQSAAEPDPAEIDRLAGQLLAIRQQLATKAPAIGRGYGQGWAGSGRAWASPGRGYGRGGFAYGGRGYGCPWGNAYGGYGRGGGRGMGLGPGRGLGPGLGFVDANGDGVCDYLLPPAAVTK